MTVTLETLGGSAGLDMATIATRGDDLELSDEVGENWEKAH